MAEIDMALMAQLDEELGRLSDGDKSLFLETLQTAAAAASRGEAVKSEAVAALASSCDDWEAVQTVLVAFQRLTAGLVEPV
ncbi:MAG: hypothetical protein H7338_21725 [Candidatus Sericytochromatia bacterium]|nr:hypothetical protein [Candidatus Sericytochromatia bacterium]